MDRVRRARRRPSSTRGSLPSLAFQPELQLPPSQISALKQQVDPPQQNWSSPQQPPAQHWSIDAQEQQRPSTQPLAGGLQTLPPQAVTRSAQVSSKQLPEQHALSAPVHDAPFGSNVWQMPLSQRWQGPQVPQMPPQPSGPQVLPAQSGTQQGCTQKGTPEHWGWPGTLTAATQAEPAPYCWHSASLEHPGGGSWTIPSPQIGRPDCET